MKLFVQALTVALVATAGRGAMIRDFGPKNFDYAYGKEWKIDGNVKTGESGGLGVVEIDASENGGAGILLKDAAKLTAKGETHLAMTARLMEGNAAGKIQVNFTGTGKSVQFDLATLNIENFVTVKVPLGEIDFAKCQQVQLQGLNWSAGARPLMLKIDKLETTDGAAVDPVAKPKVAAHVEPAAPAAEASAELSADGLQPDPPGDPAKTPLPNGKPWVPGWCRWDWRAGWVGQHNGHVARTKKGDIDVVFFGDSITQGWDQNKDVWEKLCEGTKAVNYGIGGDATRQILWRIRHGAVDGISPKLVVLKIGTNNLYGDANAGTDAEIAKGIEAIVTVLRKKLPKTKILLLGVLPRQNEYFSGRVRKINEKIAKLDDGKAVRYLDMGSSFLDAPGKIKSNLYNKDQLHLAKPGYEAWAAAMGPLFTEMLK